MNDLTSLLSDTNSNNRTTKYLEVMNSIVANALTENSREAISLLAHYLFSLKAQPILQTFGKMIHNLLITKNLLAEFESATTKELNPSFWNNHNDEQNFATISNALLICGNDFVFHNNELNLINKIIKDLSPTIKNSSQKYESNYVSTSKIIESFYQYYSDPHPFNDDSSEDFFSSIIQQTTIYQ